MTVTNSDANEPGCSRCESTPDPIPWSGMLYVAPPMIHTAEAICEAATEAGVDCRRKGDDLYAISFENGALTRLCLDDFGGLSSLELKDTKSLILAPGEQFAPSHLTRMQSLSTLTARAKGGWLLDILETERIETHFHPIVRADAPADVFAYECLARGRDEQGKIIAPGIMFDIANLADLLFNLDRTCRLAAIAGCVQHAIDKPIFVNFNPTTIYNPVFCLQTTLQAIDQAGLSPDRVVFEVVESDEINDVDHLLSILEFYRDHGFRFALDDLGAGFASLNLLTRLQPDFIKLDMELVRDVDKDDYKSVITQNILRMARQLGTVTIAEGVETAEEWHWLRDHGADLIQGYLFARPAAPPSQVVVPE